MAQTYLSSASYPTAAHLKKRDAGCPCGVGVLKNWFSVVKCKEKHDHHVQNKAAEKGEPPNWFDFTRKRSKPSVVLNEKQVPVLQETPNIGQESQLFPRKTFCSTIRKSPKTDHVTRDSQDP